MHSFRALETAAYCPRKLYYRRKSAEPPTVPEDVASKREIAFDYDRLLDDEQALRSAPLAVTPTQFRSRLGCARARLETGDWTRLVDPAERDVMLSGRDCRGVVHKRLETTPPSAALVFTGTPPETGVWHPQSVRLMAVAKALAWETETDVGRVFAEYPTHGVVREVSVDARRTAEYREALRIADAIEGPPPRTDNRSKCEPCEFSGECGVRTRSLRSLLGN
jgi:CRISPR-associated exonuclease Cas4